MPGIGTYYRASFLPSLDLANAIAEKQFLNSLGALASVILPNDGQFTNKRIRVRAAGRVATTSNLTFTVSVYFGISATIGSNTLMLSSGAQTVNAKKTNWHMDLDLFWDGDSFRMNGTGSGQVDNGPVGTAGLAVVPVGDPNLHNASQSSSLISYGFTATGLFSGSSAGNSARLDILDLELI